MKKIFLSVLSLALVFGFVGVVRAEVNAVTPSTNDINRTNDWAHVNQLSMDVGETELEFVSTRGFASCFEYRTDGDTSQANGDNYNPAVTDGLYPFTCVNNQTNTKTILADEYVEVRMVFGAESDERFDWTRFDVLQPPIPSSKDDCKKDGWREYVDSEGNPFKNQGQCVSYVETRKHDEVLVETLVLDTSNSNGVSSSEILENGKTYKFVVSGEWTNRPGEKVDAKFTTMDDWLNWADAPSGGYDPKLLDVQVNDEFVDWGLYSSDHTYSMNYIGDGNPVNFRVFDGDVSSETINEGWYGDNVGFLTINIYK